MGIFDWRGRLDRVITSLGYTKAQQPQNTRSASLFRGEATLHVDPRFAHFEEADWQKLAITSGWIYSDVDLIAKTFSKAKLKVLQREDEEQTEVESHPFELLERRPNPWMSREFLWRYTVYWLMLRGEAYWWNVPDRSGQFTELWPIPADRMAPIADGQKYISGFAYRYKDGTDTVILPPAIVTFFRLPNPFDFHRGLSPISACRLGLQTDREAQEWNLNAFRRGAPLKMIISVPADISDVALDQFKMEIHEQFEQGQQYLIGRAGEIDAERVGLQPADLEFLAGREFTREELDRVYGIPAGFWAKEATRANSEAAEAVLIEHTVMPLHTLMAGQITTQLLPAYGEGLEAEFEDIRKEDRALVIEERKQNWLVYTVNEAREELGMEPLSDPLVGELLVPLATKAPAPGGGGFTGGGASVPMEDDQDLIAAREFKTDLWRWRTLSLRRHRRGEAPGDFTFSSAWIPPQVCDNIIVALKTAQNEEEIKRAFDRTPYGGGIGVWSDYP